MANNLKKMQEFGLKNLSTEFNNSVSQSASKKGEKSANKKTNSEDSDSSEYLLEDDDQGDSDDDDTESDVQPQPLQLRCFFYLQSTRWGIFVLHLNVFNLFFNICPCF